MMLGCEGWGLWGDDCSPHCTTALSTFTLLEHAISVVDILGVVDVVPGSVFSVAIDFVSCFSQNRKRKMVL